MKVINTLPLFWASQASMAAGHEDDSNNKAAAPFHFSKKFVGKANLRGADEAEPQQVATSDAENGELLSQSTAPEWLDAHNAQRKERQEDFGVDYKELRWSVGLKDQAREWARELAKDCNIRFDPDEEYGGNIMGRTGGSGVPTAEQAVNTWMRKVDQGYPANGSATQVLWRPSEFVGCGSARSETENCSYSVCYYAKPGNCNMGQFRGGDKWEEVTYADDSPCEPACPPEGCN